jgi:hypothetical protein
MMEKAKIDRFDDERINEAAALDKNAELQAAMESKYTNLSSVMSEFTDKMKNRVTERFEAGREKVAGIATDINKSVHENRGHISAARPPRR